jgi:hypothetical protein
MSATGLDVFDKTFQATNIWLDEIVATLGPDRQLAWKVLSVVLHKLRDRMPVELSAHLGAELPLLVRGVYYDQFEPAKQPTDLDVGEFTHEVSEWLSECRGRPRPANSTKLVGYPSHERRGRPRASSRLTAGTRNRRIPAPSGRGRGVGARGRS